MTASPVVPQRMAALAAANRVRVARAELKHQVARGERTAADVVRDPPWMAETMTIIELLMSQPCWGPSRSRKLLASVGPVGMCENKTLGSMTERQRAELAARLADTVTPRDAMPVMGKGGPSCV